MNYKMINGIAHEIGLTTELNNKRIGLLKELQANDRNGVFIDNDSIDEFDEVVTLEYAEQLYKELF